MIKKTYTHKEEPYKLRLDPGYYFVALWGANGGFGCRNAVRKDPGGQGAFVSARLEVRKALDLFLFVGSSGKNSSCLRNTNAAGGWNGGGMGGMDTDDGKGYAGVGNDGAGGGGGATDLRLEGAGGWDDLESLKSRILVAAGGSGSQFDRNGAPGGDLVGYYTNESNDFVESITSQTNGNALGKGADGAADERIPSSGAGGGYYGGNAGKEGHWDISTTASSGSSFAAGYKGCKLMTEELSKKEITISYQIIIPGHKYNFPEINRNNDGYAIIIKQNPDCNKKYKDQVFLAILILLV